MNGKTTKNKKSLRNKTELVEDLKLELHSDPEKVYEDLVRIKMNFDQNEETQELISFLQCVGNKTDRFKMVNYFGQNKQSNSDLQDKLKKKQPAVSHQLKVLGDEKIIAGEKEGKYTYYSLNQRKFEDMGKRLSDWVSHITNWFGASSK